MDEHMLLAEEGGKKMGFDEIFTFSEEELQEVRRELIPDVESSEEDS